MDERPRRGRFRLDAAIAEGARCWNGLTATQQLRLSSAGLIDWDDYGGGPCPNAAEVAVVAGIAPGPRFYCRQCAGQF